MTFELQWPCSKSLLSTGVKEFFERGMWELGLLVLAASILFPALKILGMLYVLVPLELQPSTVECRVGLSDGRTMSNLGHDGCLFAGRDCCRREVG